MNVPLFLAAGVDIPVWLIAPFGLLLLLIATMPLTPPKVKHVWDNYYPHVAIGLGALVVGGAAVGAAAAGAAVGASAAGAAVGAAAGVAAPPQAASNAAPLAVNIPRKKFRRERRFVSSDICVLLCMNFTRQLPQPGLRR